jgi:hypothetical protein
MKYKPSPIRFAMGLNPSPDNTEQNTRYIINADRVRFRQQNVEKMGGWVRETLSFVDLQLNPISGLTTYTGCPRSTLSFEVDNNQYQAVGTHAKFYLKQGNNVTNITPLKTVATATLAGSPLAITDTEKTMTVTYAAHGLAAGDRIKLTGASNTGGVTAATYINIEHIISSVVDVNSFTIEMEVAATSTTTGGGGASVQIFTEIDAGGCDAAAATGPGIGLPGAGLPGSIGTDLTLLVQPRIWWIDTYGDNMVCGTGQQGSCYEWTGDLAVAPQVIANAPLADWGWIEDAKLCVLSGNVVANSDTGDLTNWTTGSAYSDAKEDANKLIYREYVNGENLIFAAENKVFRLRFVGGTAKWIWKQISGNIGIVAPLASIEAGGYAFVFGKDNLYYYNGNAFTPIPNNTMYRTLYDNINLSQLYKCFCWYNQKFNELWMHYPTEDSAENNRVIIFDIADGHFNKLESLDRTAADRAGQIGTYPIALDSSGNSYTHENGYNEAGAAMNSFLQLSYEAIKSGQYLTEVDGMEPDIILTGEMDIELYGKDRAQDSGTLLHSRTIDSTTGIFECEEETRWRSWLMRSNELGGFFRLGGMIEQVSKGSEF